MLSAEQEIVHVMLPVRLTEGVVVRRVRVDGAAAIAANVPLVRHAGRAGFDFGNDGPGASDLALACVHAVLMQMDYVGPLAKLWDGSRVYRLALDLQGAFLAQFIAPAQGDELRIPWGKALAWTRRALLDVLRDEGITLQRLVDDWRQAADALPDPPPAASMDIAELTRSLRAELAEMAGVVSVLNQYLGMVA